MKKIAVLLMFVAFASFITGCSLSGKSRDEAGLDALTSSQVPFALETKIEGVTIQGNLRGNITFKLADIKAMTSEIDGVTLPYWAHALDNGILKVVFKAQLPTIKVLEMVAKKEVNFIVKSPAKGQMQTFSMPLPKAIAENIEKKSDVAPKIKVEKDATGDYAAQVIVVSEDAKKQTKTDDEKQKEKEGTSIITFEDTATEKEEVKKAEVVTVSDNKAKQTELEAKINVDAKEFVNNATITNSKKPTFGITLNEKGITSTLELSDKRCNFDLVVTKKDSNTKISIKNEKIAAGKTYDDENFLAEIVDKEIKISIKKSLTNGEYTIEIPSLILKNEANDEFKLMGSVYKFNINVQD